MHPITIISCCVFIISLAVIFMLENKKNRTIARNVFIALLCVSFAIAVGSALILNDNNY